MSSDGKRGALSICESILQAVKDAPELKTPIAYKSRLDSRTIERYLPLLVELHLIARTSSGKYEITKKGIDFLKQYDKLKKYGVGA